MLQSINPYTEEVIKTYPEHSRQEIENIIEMLYQHFQLYFRLKVLIKHFFPGKRLNSKNDLP